jgi:hypothetical protein
MVLEELQLPFNSQYKELTETKTDDYLQINPNGRLPAIKDPNSGLTLWEVSTVPRALYSQIQTYGRTVWCHHSLSHRPVRHRRKDLVQGFSGEISDSAVARFPDLR